MSHGDVINEQFGGRPDSCPVFFLAPAMDGIAGNENRRTRNAETLRGSGLEDAPPDAAEGTRWIA